MEESNFTSTQIENWKKFEKVRSRGKYNMLMPQARTSTGLDKDDYLFVIENFDALKKQALK